MIQEEKGNSRQTSTSSAWTGRKRTKQNQSGTRKNKLYFSKPRHYCIAIGPLYFITMKELNLETQASSVTSVYSWAESIWENPIKSQGWIIEWCLIEWLCPDPASRSHWCQWNYGPMTFQMVIVQLCTSLKYHNLFTTQHLQICF